MATAPLPTPPDVRQQQQGGVPPQSMLSRFGQMQSESQNADMKAKQEIASEIGKIAESTKKIAEMSDKTMPSLMGDISKLIEIGKSMQQSVAQAIQQTQQGSSASPEQPPATSPTDAPEPMAA
jgi:hypothetical protein